MTLSISDLFSVATPDEWFDAMLADAAGVGLTTTAWDSGGQGVTILEIDARAHSAEDQIIATYAQGGFLDPAATVTPQGGPGWLDLLSQYLYGNQRIHATYASGSMLLTNTSATNYGPFSPGTYHVANPSTGATYSNTTALTIVAGTSTTAAFAADVAGTGSTSAPGTITQPVTSLVGVTVTNPGSFVGSNAETNLALVARDRAKLASLSPNGPKGAYQYFALTSSSLDPTITTPITRATVAANPLTGVVTTTIANAAGAPISGDVAKVNTIIQANVVPEAVTAVVQGANNHAIAVVTTIYVPAVNAGSAAAVVSAALATYFANLPIGGVTDVAPNIVPYDGVLGAIFAAAPYIQDATLTLNGTTTNVTLATTDVAILSPTPVITVVPV